MVLMCDILKKTCWVAVRLRYKLDFFVYDGLKQKRVAQKEGKNETNYNFTDCYFDGSQHAYGLYAGS